jgi:DNA repair exonuclease SbcCD nuclease subunit
MGFLSGLIGSAANFGLDQMSNSVNSKRQQFYNERNMELQHEYQKKMVDYVAEKNEPRKAVARWRAAGIAPEAVFGNSPGGAGVASDASAPSSSNPDGGSSRYDFFRTAAEQQQMENDRKIADATVNKLNAEADKLRGDTKDPDVTKRQQKLDFDWTLVKKEREEVQLAIEEIEKMYKDAEKQADLSIKQQILFETLAKIDKLMADKEVSEQMKENLKSQKALIEAQTKTEGSKQRNFDSSTGLNEAQTKTEDELREGRKSELSQRVKSLAAERRLTLTRYQQEQVESWLFMNGADRSKTLWEVVDKLTTSSVLGKNMTREQAKFYYYNFLKTLGDIAKEYE